MGLLDFILNLAGLLIWLNWRFLILAKRDPGPGGISLAGTLKSTASARAPSWPYLAGLGGLLLLRALAYYTIGSNLHSNMILSLGIVPISFNPRMLMRMFLFSGLSFLVFAGIFYFWMLLFSIVTRNVTEPDACLRLLRQHLGWWHRRPVWFRLLSPFVLAAAFWLVFGRILEEMGMFPAQSSASVRFFRAFLVGVYAYTFWIPPLVGLLVLYVAQSYVYFGDAAFWKFVQTSGRIVVSWVGKWQIRFQQVEITPIVMVILLWWIGWTGQIGFFRGGARWLLDFWNQLH